VGTLEPVRLDPINLRWDESPPDHPCADVRHTETDLALLHYLLQDLRALGRRASTRQARLSAYEPLTWTVHGLVRRLVICDPKALLQRCDRRIVGFLGNRRSTHEAQRVDTAELDVIGEFPSFPGIISYSSLELVDDQWVNLVVHTEDSDRMEWRHSEVHIEAAEQLAPSVYHDIRIHNGRIPDGPIGSGTIMIESTKYFDYDSNPTWHAIRPVFPSSPVFPIDTAEAPT